MKLLRVLTVTALAGSCVLNVLLWREALRARAEADASNGNAKEIEELRAEIESLTKKPVAVAGLSDTAELARLRGEIGLLRKQAAEANTLRAQAGEAVSLKNKLRSLEAELTAAKRDFSEVIKIPPEQLAAMKTEAQAAACLNNMKQIGLAARLWANDHNDRFPPDLLSMTNELSTPKILFCPADPSGIRASTWAEVNPATISYRFVNANGSDQDPPHKELTTCPIHGHTGYSDGSVFKGKR